MKTRLPIYGHEIRVVLSDDVGDAHGEFDLDKKEILIEKVCKFKEEILFHEACHAVLGLSGLSEILGNDKEEAVVRALQYGLWPLIKDGAFDK